MTKKVLLVSVPAPAVEQTQEENEFWRWHYALKTRLTYPNLSKEQLLKLGNSENQNVGLLSIASVLRDNGVEVGYLASSLSFNGSERENNFLDKLLGQIQQDKPDYIGFSSHTCGIPAAIKYALEAKKVSPEIVTIIGGAHANGASGETLDELLENFDFVIRGKGEIPFLELVKSNQDVVGISYKRKDEKIIMPISVASFPEYPNPANDLLNVEELPAARVFTSLGCRKGSQCVFCADTLHNKGFVKRPVEEALKEIKFLYDNLGTRYFYFGDENFFLDKKRALEIMNMVNSLDLDIIVGYQVRIESADEDLIKKAAESKKCTEIQYGVESASQEVLDFNRKGLRIKRVREVCDLTKSYGVNTHCYFLVGLPGETQETAELTIKKMEEMLEEGSADFVEYRCVVPFPGAPMWELAENYGVKLKHKNWRQYRGENLPTFDLENLTSEHIYQFYLKGLAKVTELYKKRYLSEFGNNIPDISVLSAVTEGGF